MFAVHIRANMINLMKEYKISWNNIWEITLPQLKCWVEKEGMMQGKAIGSKKKKEMWLKEVIFVFGVVHSFPELMLIYFRCFDSFDNKLNNKCKYFFFKSNKGKIIKSNKELTFSMFTHRLGKNLVCFFTLPHPIWFHD